MIPYFEKGLRSVAQEVRYTFCLFVLFNKLFYVDINIVCLILLLLLLLRHVIDFEIS